MSDKVMRPKFEPATNIPTTVKLNWIPVGPKDNGYGPSWMYGIIHDGVEKVWFVTDNVQADLSAFAKGDSVSVVCKEGKNQNSGKTYKYFEVGGHAALFENSGKVVPKPQSEKNPQELSSDRAKSKQALLSAIEDVLEIQTELLGWGSRTDLFNPDTVQRFATTLFINRNGH